MLINGRAHRCRGSRALSHDIHVAETNGRRNGISNHAVTINKSYQTSRLRVTKAKQNLVNRRYEVTTNTNRLKFNHVGKKMAGNRDRKDGMVSTTNILTGGEYNKKLSYCREKVRLFVSISANCITETCAS